ncbi:glycosyltransferase family 2 protein [Gluconobacter cerinus]|uniref:glycosyltransferase family 2 protein n=1 Tax=Gluconobacter cerinus TaxID=38307 RepID=UPI001B8BE457|nr:glycosyltransferase family 2 protein [Gluconobacter cerinus]MBS0995871.1 glycosyltransferase family 2 protein [Gluconobacter cerinus]
MTKVAAILFVKNEVEDISWWISWHLALGFSDIIIYDDYSEDGTWELINSIKNTLNVRCLRSKESEWFNDRQKLTYLDALDRFREEFDWIIFLDSDEYITINDRNVSDFLSRYDDADSVSINWRCYGSNGNVFKPYSPNVFDNYTKYSSKDYEYNYVVKTFIRPKSTKTKYINPHRFEVYGRSVTTDNVDIVWQEEHPERTLSPANWDIAQINHFIIRSAEHYIEKVRRRSDIRSSGMGMGLFNYCDRNDIENDKFSENYYKNIYDGIFTIQRILNNNFLHYISNEGLKLLEINEKIINSIVNNEKIFDVYCVETYHGTKLSSNPETGQLSHNVKDELIENDVLFFTSPLMEDIAFFFSKNKNGKLFIKSDSRVSEVISYKIIKNENGTFSFKNPLTNQYLSATIEDFPNNIVSNRGKIDMWESYNVNTVECENLNKNWILSTLKHLAYSNIYDVAMNSEIDNRVIDAIIGYAQTFDTKWFFSKNNYNIIFDFPWIIKQKKLSN